MRLLGWLLLASGGLLGLGAILAAFAAVFGTGTIWLFGGRFTEGMGTLLIGLVVVAGALLFGALAVIAGVLVLLATPG